MGNPTHYFGCYEYEFTWRGKQLVGAKYPNATNPTWTYSFEYNEDGLRQRKQVTTNGITVNTDYYYNGSVLIGMQRANDVFRFSYNAGGSVVFVNFNGTEYYYLRNAQGDIVKLIDGSGTTVVEYTYDTWGKKVSITGTLASTLGQFQPFRYRGYVYDEETGFYYLQSRYYDPVTGRFISADILLSTGQGVLGHNCYAYCLDNPVRFRDSQGRETEEGDQDENESDPLIVELITDNVEKAKKHALSNYPTPIGLDPNTVQSIQTAQALVELSKYLWFYTQVKSEGPMDYKVKTNWNAALPSLSYPGNNGEDKEYMLNGQKISASDLGNINYGAMGAAMGIPLDTLLRQAGAAQLRKPVSEGGKDLGFFESQIKINDYGYSGYYGDQKDDFYSIIQGYELYLGGFFG